MAYFTDILRIIVMKVIAMNNNLKAMLEEIEQTGISDIEADLDAEMKKNAEERDLKKIKMLIELILKMKGEDEDVLNEELHKALIFENVTAQKKQHRTTIKRQLMLTFLDYSRRGDR